MNNTRRLTLAGLFLALALVLPFVTMQIPQFGQMLTPMHFPIILAGIFLGARFGFILGAVAPLLRFSLFGLPMFPMALSMSFELAVYGLVVGLMIYVLREVKWNSLVKVLLSVAVAMILGRLTFAFAAMFILKTESFIGTFIATFTSSFIGIILQLILIPIITYRLKDVIEYN